MKQFRYYAPEDTRLLKLAILKQCYELGIKEPPNQMQLTRTCEFLQEGYPQLSTEAMLDAFNLALLGKIDCDPTHYQSMDHLYLSKILNAYLKHKSDQLRKHAEVVRKEVARLAEEYRKENPEVLTVEQYIKWFKIGWEEYNTKGYAHWWGGQAGYYIQHYHRYHPTKKEIEDARERGDYTPAIILNNFYDRVKASGRDIESFCIDYQNDTFKIDPLA